MIAFLVRRLASMVLILILISLLIFMVTEVLPGDAAMMIL